MTWSWGVREPNLKQIRNLYRKQTFARDVTILSLGTAFSQVLAIAVTPILSRLYDPVAFGMLGVILALAAPLSEIAGGKYELAIVLAKDDKEAANIFALTWSAVLCTALLTAVIMWLFGARIAELLGVPAAAPLLPLAAIAVLFSGWYESLTHWITRTRRFVRQTISETFRSSAISVAQILAGINGLGAIGLIFGRIIGGALATAVLSVQVWRDEGRVAVGSISLRGMRDVARAHGNFPKFNMPRTALFSSSNNLPSIFLAAFFGPAAAGLYWFTFRLLWLPSSLVGNAVRRVFYQRAVTLYHQRQPLWPIFKKTTIAMTLMGGPPVLLIVLAAPALFEFCFGADWRHAGVYAQWLVVWWFCTFVNVPATMIVPIFGLQRILLGFELFAVAFRLAAMFCGVLMGSDVLTVALYAAAGTFVHALQIIYVARVTIEHDRSIAE